MNMHLYPRPRRGPRVLPILGWFLAVGIGIWLVWYGFIGSEGGGQADGTPPQAGAQATSDTPRVVAGDDGVIIRSGPGFSHPRLGYLEPGAQAELTGRDGDWYQIQYDGAQAWVLGKLVTTLNEELIEPAPAQATAPTPVQAEPVPAGDEAWPAEVFELINTLRAEQGLPPYTYNETLERAAQLHGQDCQQRGDCNHTGSDGSTAGTRIKRAGYDAADAAEIIVYSSSPQAAVDWWMDETPPDDPHRSTVLHEWFTEIGVAVVPTGRGDYYFIADFGRPATP